MAEHAEYKRPLPLPDEETADYWEGARRHQLIIRRCQDCQYYIHYPKARCPRCRSANVSGSPVSGRGRIYSYSIVHVALAPGFDPPYAVVLVELDEQSDVRILTNLVDCPLDEVRIGMPVEVVYHDVTPETTLPQFRPTVAEAHQAAEPHQHFRPAPAGHADVAQRPAQPPTREVHG